MAARGAGDPNVLIDPANHSALMLRNIPTGVAGRDVFGLYGIQNQVTPVLSQTARWAAKQKLQNMVAGIEKVKSEIGV